MGLYIFHHGPKEINLHQYVSWYQQCLRKAWLVIVSRVSWSDSQKLEGAKPSSLGPCTILGNQHPKDQSYFTAVAVIQL